MTPYRKFRLTLILTLVIGIFVIGVAGRWIMLRGLERDLVGQVQDIVRTHVEAELADKSLSVELAPSTAEWAEAVAAQLRAELVSGIVLYTPTVTEVFASAGLDPIPPQAVELVEDAVAKSTVATGASVYQLGRHPAMNYPVLWLVQPLYNVAGDIHGYVLAARDVRSEMDVFTAAQIWLGSLLLMTMVIVYVVLGRTYRDSTRVIREHGEALRAAVHQVETTYDRTLVALSRAIDLRDHETDGHSVRVTAYSLALAAALGVEGPEVLDLARGALLHDIGKLGIPDSILLKQGPLTDEEWEQMRRHPELGHALLRDIVYLRGSLDIVLQHHERYDGRGYPFGLHGQRISPLARLFAVADSFDAMTSDRPYRSRLTYVQAREEILRGRGKQFDPAAVDAFAAVAPEAWERLAAEAQEVRDGAGLRRLIGSGVSPGQALLAVGTNFRP